MAHPLLDRLVLAEIEQAVSAHLGRRWVSETFSDTDDRASHPCGVFHGRSFAVFVKAGTGPDAQAQFAAELDGLRLLSERAGIRTPAPVGSGLIARPGTALLLFEALPERPPGARQRADWISIGHTLAALHAVTGTEFGLGGTRGFFGPLPQDNRPVPTNRWADFYAERRLAPLLRMAVDSGHLPPELAAGLNRVVERLPGLCGPGPQPALLHGDAQQNNFISTPAGAVAIDPAPYFGHPEIDLALVDYFEPVPGEVFDAYRERAVVDPGFPERRELWRMCGYLAVVAVAGGSPIGREHLARLAAAVRKYR